MTLTVAINVPVTPGGGGGGTEQHVLGIVRALARSDNSDIEFVLVVDDPDPDWLTPYLTDTMRLERPAEPGPLTKLGDRVRKAAKRAARPILKRQNFHNRLRPEPTVPSANGRFASINADVVHYPTTPYLRTDLPSIFCPHDLQHRHYPEFFNEWTLKRRRVRYPAGCTEADAVVAPSKFVKSDIKEAYDVPDDRIHVVPRGPPIDLYESVSDEARREVVTKYDLPESFALYPAQTMEHKNHVRLIQAVAQLRDRNTPVNLVLTGKRSEYWPTVKRAISDAGVDDHVHVLGFIPGSDLRALYQLADFVVVPSLFEGGGFPLIESWAESTPITCSDTTALGEQAGDAALTFDPESVDAIADAMHRMQTDPDLRSQLVERGNARIDEYSWEETAETYIDLYKSVAAESGVA